MAEDILDQASNLRHAGEPFALATVVRVTRPASARPGAKAIVRADGAISGWVGGRRSYGPTGRSAAGSAGVELKELGN